jgi:hypothetical protein
VIKVAEENPIVFHDFQEWKDLKGQVKVLHTLVEVALKLKSAGKLLITFIHFCRNIK